MKNLMKYPVLFVLLVLFFSGCFSIPSFFDSFQDNPVYRDKLAGTWTLDTIESGEYDIIEFKSDGTGSTVWYEDNKVVQTWAFEYKVSGFQVAFRFVQSRGSISANYVITDNNTLSLVSWSNGADNETYFRSNVAQSEVIHNEIANALKKATDTIIPSLQKEAIIAIISISSDNSEVSEFIAGELEFLLVNNSFIVVDRSQLDKIRQEQNFQLSQDVDDSSAVTMGKFAGANIVITGTISGSGNMRRLRLRALDTQTARVVGAASEALPDETVSRQPNANVPSESTSFKIGDRGPAGGTVFYDRGTSSDGWRYLEAAPAETEFSAQWSTRTAANRPGLRDDIGFGKRNTDQMGQYSDQYPAARLCASINFNGFNDWFFPSIEELDLMYKNLKQKGLGGFGNNWYWSSSVADKGYRALYLRFNDGRQGYGEAAVSLSVRAIRAF